MKPLLVPPKFQKRSRYPRPPHFTNYPHLLFSFQEILEQFPLLFPEAIRLPQLQGCVLLGLLPQVFTLFPGEAGHAWERVQEQGVHECLERFHGAAEQLLNPREPRDRVTHPTRG